MVQIYIQPILLNQVANGGLGSIPQGMQFFMVQVYQEIFVNGRFGYGSALLWVFLLVILIVTLFVLRTSRLWVYYEVDREHA